ncbi:hypothetical protein AMAG_20281 [Allomyces macrogynus ATCC 38327]|uniref:F-box domain-containing protein n=1 Tax=Allomyces macrogynus (strain ATCC 38327) TaxID=578462 RepID=A0A0L0T8M0_ALLM3|nr:hypothetical protein AMAG_20281 [Allomyces macrogynus ATCC 38327]|eukprot:KNE71041.1 hypothetical protein AMAG_20281 [Allomyces macrogynus ATCC 38327]
MLAGIALHLSNLTAVKLPPLIFSANTVTATLTPFNSRLTWLHLRVLHSEWHQLAMTLNMPNLRHLEVHLTDRLKGFVPDRGRLWRYDPVSALPLWSQNLQVLHLHAPADIAPTFITHDLQRLAETLREVKLVTHEEAVMENDDDEQLPPSLIWPVLRILDVPVAAFRIMAADSIATRDAFPQLRSLHLKHRPTNQRVMTILPSLFDLLCVTNLSMKSVQMPFAELERLAACSPHLAHLSIVDCSFSGPTHAAPIVFPALVKLVTRNSKLDRLGAAMILPRLETLCVDGFSPLCVTP